VESEQACFPASPFLFLWTCEKKLNGLVSKLGGLGMPGGGIAVALRLAADYHRAGSNKN
jgi:hypothetical protein